MPDKILTDRVRELLKSATVDYLGNRETLNQNLAKTGAGLAGLAVLHFIPGPQPLLDVVIVGYTGIKGYQALRDWLS